LSRRRHKAKRTKAAKESEQLRLAPDASARKATTPQNLGALIKSVRDIMRKDKGLSGDLDRIPMITWVMFLKLLDDQEQVREAEAKLAGKKFQRTIEPPYRWRDWAAKESGITGSELIAFINQDEAVRPDGSRGPGLFAYLRSLSGSEERDRRDVVGTVFKGTVNRMLNGYLVRDVINRINGIHFDATDEIHTLAFLYESLLKEMRDTAGDSGEFYTPRPVIRFMVQVIDPQIGETVLDPAAGTGGFLVETFKHLSVKCKKAEDFERLQGTLFGFEAKPMPFLLCQMNMLLHGMETPEVDSGNALRFPLREMGEKDRVDIVLTNPPFGGEEERGILGNFPEDKQTTETALLFLQLIMRKLRRSPKPGRAGIVVPNGTLFGDGVCARIKEELLNEFNLHTVVRLPNGVFAPYAGIPTNLLFFDRSGPTKEIWYYEQPLPEGRNNYTKTRPMQYEEFEPCLTWWKNRQEGNHAWRVSAKDVLKYDEQGNLVSANLDIKNPCVEQSLEHLPPSQLVENALKEEERIIELLLEIKQILLKAEE
jgi:type I restriction enzyme M protein